jgi:4-hydroxy-tetrahydrodipicolinate synthase
MKCKILTPAITVFNENGSIDYEGNKKVIEFLIENGVDGIVPLGSSGEFPDIGFDERKKFLEFYIKEIDGRVEAIAGTSSMNYDEVVEMSNFAIECGANGVMIIPPYYFAISQEQAYRYYERLAGDISGDIYIYNYPARSGFDIEPQTLARLAKNHKNIKGMKDSTTSIEHTKNCIYAVKEYREDFEVYSGFDNHFIPNVMAGGSGCIAAISNILPELWAEWIKATREDNLSEITRIQLEIDDLMQLYGIDSNFSLLYKKLMKERGLGIESTTLFPFDLIDDEKYEKALRIFKNHAR